MNENIHFTENDYEYIVATEQGQSEIELVKLEPEVTMGEVYLWLTREDLKQMLEALD